MKDIRTTGERLSDKMKEQRITIQQLSEKTGVSATTIQALKTDKRPVQTDNLLPICQYFNVTTDWLLCNSDVEQADENLQVAHAYTCLSQKALKALHGDRIIALYLKDDIHFVIEALLTHDEGLELVRRLATYLKKDYPPDRLVYIDDMSFTPGMLDEALLRTVSNCINRLKSALKKDGDTDGKS